MVRVVVVVEVVVDVVVVVVVVVVDVAVVFSIAVGFIKRATRTMARTIPAKRTPNTEAHTHTSGHLPQQNVEDLNEASYNIDQSCKTIFMSTVFAFS